jgi:hypothetical protein
MIPNEQKIHSSLGLLLSSGAWQSLHYAHYQNPITVTGISFNLTIVFSSEEVTYEVEGLGKITYKYPTAVVSPDDFFRGLGTRSALGQGPCTVYFDDVYVLRP